MIPKVIHYCWFGNNKMTKNMIKCISSWKKYCPDYEIIEWNEKNFDVNCIPFVKEAYQSKKFAFVADYARLKIIYENGGIYLDTDVEIIKKLDDLLVLDAYVGMQSAEYINTGLGFGAKRGNKMIFELMADYENRHFISEKCAELACPILNTKIFEKYGFLYTGETQEINGVTVLPSDYLNPKNCETYRLKLTDNTYSIHHYDSTWKTRNDKAVKAIMKSASIFLGEANAIKLKEKVKEFRK